MKNLYMIFDRFKKSLLGLLLLTVTFAFSCASTLPQGHFAGKAEIIVSWCKQDSLAFDLFIHKDGNVSGKAGEATIVSGKVKPNKFGSGEFIIDAVLEGYVVKNENIKRQSIKIIFNYDGEKITGGFHTSGSKFGGKDKMMMSGSGMVLLRKR